MQNQTIDLSEVQSIKELHSIFQQHLNFPDFYGKNWDAFWDAITGLVEMPNVLTLKSWSNFENKFPKDSQILRETIDNYNKLNGDYQIERV